MRRRRRHPDNPDLFTWVAPEPETTSYARSSDPETSHEAADKISLSNMEQVVYDVLAETGERMTSLCITRYLEDRRGDNRAWSVSPRLRPLEEKGAIKRDGKMTVENSNGRDAKLTAWIVVKKTTNFARPGQERPPAHQVDITVGYGD